MPAGPSWSGGPQNLRQPRRQRTGRANPPDALNPDTDANGVSGIRLVVLGGRPAVTESDGEGVQHGLPAHRPSGAAGPGGVQAASHKIQALWGGLLGREMTARSYRATVTSVQ